MPHLLVDLSFHGFGHIAQTAPVVNALAERMPNLRVTLRSGAPRRLLEQRFSCDFELIPRALDFGMEMADALTVRVEGSAAAYRDFHHNWEGKVAREAEEMAALAPSLVLADVPYLSLAAAAQAGIPTVAMCSLNWADIYYHYCYGRPEAGQIHAQMLEAYRSARHFLQLRPGMAMKDLPNRHEIGPVAQLGRHRRAEIDRRLGLAAGEKLVLVAMGGVVFRLPMENWPHLPNVRWLVPSPWKIERPDVLELEAVGMDFSDVLASCDALLSKPGYGSFAEAACNGIPVLYAARRDWPESECLTAWLAQAGRCLEVPAAALQSGALASWLEALWALPSKPPVKPDGIRQAAELLQGLLEN